MRVHNVDVLKAICAFLVVCIHIPFPGIMGEYFTALCRIAVPTFFMITGFFYANIIEKNRKFRQIKKIFALFLEANIIYFVWGMSFAIIDHNQMFFQTIFSIKNLLIFLILNESPFEGHLWYLGAILYVLIIIMFTDKMNCRKFLYCLSPILLIGDLVFGKYSIVILGREFPFILVRNFLFVGIPYFCIGLLIREGLGRKLSKKVLKWMILFFSLTSVMERYILISLDMNSTRDHYISTTFLAVSVFLFTIKNISKGEVDNNSILKNDRRKNIVAILERIGQKYSTWLYILHPIFITCIGFIVNKIGIYEKYRFVAPIFVYVSTVIFCFCVEKIFVRIKEI